MMRVMGAALVAAGCGWTFAGELPESFKVTNPQAVFSKRPERFSYESFAGKAVNWSSGLESPNSNSQSSILNAQSLPTGCPEFEIERPRPHGGAVVKATDFGFSPAHSNNASCITRAIAYAKEIGADRVELAPGVYRCHDKEGVVVSGTRDLLIDGKGACLVFYRPSVSRNVRVTGNRLLGSGEAGLIVER